MPVSIHAPREGCDVTSLPKYLLNTRFNSRTPGGVRPNANALRNMREQFQFTHPGRGATMAIGVYDPQYVVSIHAPREGCDWLTLPLLDWGLCFNSRTPGGVRRLEIM